MNLPWQLHPDEASPVREALCRGLGLHPMVAAILERRGIATVEEAERYLRPSLDHLHDPFLLKGMDQAAGRIVRALVSGERIVISGDYDVDGITSSALLMQFLRGAGCRDVEVFIPNRFDHGYGLTERSAEALLERKPAVVITVDNGITAVDEVTRLQAAGVETIVTDHHLPRDSGVPPGIVINPLQPGCAYPFQGISGCGVTFKLITALRKRLREEGWWNDSRPEPNLKGYLDLVAIGTVADVVPLLGENRVLVHFGLEVLNRPPRRPGIEAILALGRPERVDARTIGFRIAPRLNAAGRMADGGLAVELLLADDASRAAELAQRLEAENNKRRAKGEEMLREALAQVDQTGADSAAGIVVASPSFHEGIIGITAAKLAERFHRPAVVLAPNGESYKGSARSRPGLNVTAAFDACADLFTDYGGHAGAAGCRLPMDNLASFRTRFVEACAAQSEQAPPPVEFLDGSLEPAAIDAALVEQIARLEPFGRGNERPEFLVQQRHLPASPEPLGKGHLKWRLDGGAEMVAWRAAEDLRSPGSEARYRVTLGFNDFRGRRTVQLTVEDFLNGD